MSYSLTISAIRSTSGGPSGGGGNVPAFAGSPRPVGSFSANPPGVTIPRHLTGSCPTFFKPCTTPLGMIYRDELDAGLSPATVQKIHAVLHKALVQAVRWNMVPRNATDAVKAPRPTPAEMRPLSPGEARTLLETSHGDRLGALYVLAVHTGIRQGELLALKWEDVDLNAGVVRVRRALARSGGRIAVGEPKTRGSRRTVYLTGAAVEALRGHLERQLEDMGRLGDLYRDHGLVFTSGVGTPINPTNLRRRSLAPLLEKAGLTRIRFHDLRHTCATLQLSRNVHPKYVQELLGHAAVAITLDTYDHAGHLFSRDTRNG